MSYTVTVLTPFGVMIEANSQAMSVADVDIARLRVLLDNHALVVLRGFDTFTQVDAFADYCANWGEVSLWPFGKVLELIEQDHPQDHIFDHSYVPLHWDGMYRPQVPEYQIFHCVTAPLSGKGGRTTFSNTRLALEHLPEELKVLFNQVTGVYQRKMEFYHSRTISPIITQHPFKQFSVIRYNEPPAIEQRDFINPPDLEFIGIPHQELAFFHDSLRQVLYDPRYFYAHAWQDSDVVIADNFSLLHGREAFVAKSPRHIQRVHILSNPPFDNPGLESYS